MIRRIWPLLAGFTLWAAAFVALYALQHLGCSLHWDPATHRLVLIAAYALAVVLLVATLILQLRRTRAGHGPISAVHTIGIGATLAALAATVVVFLPTLLVSACL